MAEQEKTETVETQATETEAVEAPETQATETGGSVEERIARMEAALKKANTEAAKYRKQAQSFEKAEEERKRAEMSETERIKADLEQTKAELERARLDNLKSVVAAEIGLPPILAQRLRGNDKESLTEDAKALLESIPKPEKKTQSSISATNPGTGSQVKETIEQKKERLFGQPGDPFSDEVLLRQGGGVYFVDKE